MTTYESDIKTISSGEEMVFGILSDLNNLSRIAENPELNEKVKDLQFDTDSCSFGVEAYGRIGFRIVEREAFKTIKLESENSPILINIWIQIKEIAENDTKMKLTLKAELPAMIKMMLDKKLKSGINAIADALAKTLSK
ncbi:MAG: SRPBCC family protein [Paludibacteraceae bacterium]|nr:SRPBCC family protein [Paludibacteraceae bacterium]